MHASSWLSTFSTMRAAILYLHFCTSVRSTIIAKSHDPSGRLPSRSSLSAPYDAERSALPPASLLLHCERQQLLERLRCRHRVRFLYVLLYLQSSASAPYDAERSALPPASLLLHCERQQLLERLRCRHRV